MKAAQNSIANPTINRFSTMIGTNSQKQLLAGIVAPHHWRFSQSNTKQKRRNNERKEM
jgi:hypothetical protein